MHLICALFLFARFTQALAEPICDGKEITDKCWMNLTATADCLVWYDKSTYSLPSRPIRLEPRRADWTGGCQQGRLRGDGTLRLSDGPKYWIEFTTFFDKGKMYGPAVVKYWNENSANGKYINSVRQGEWTRTHGKFGWLARGPYVDGVRHGTWLERQPHRNWATISEGAVVKGKRQGRWITRDESGKVIGEATYVDNNPHGTSTLTYPDGKKMVYEWEHGKLIQSTAIHPSGWVEVSE